MSEITWHHAKRNHHSDDVIVAPYTWAANKANSYNRFAAVALLSGIDVVNMSVPGTGDHAISRAQRLALHQGNITRLASLEAERMAELTQKHDRVIGWGDSGRGIWVAAEQAADTAKPYSHVLIRDGLNFYAPEPRLAAIMRLRKASYRGVVAASTVPDDPQTIGDKADTARQAVTEIYDHATLMCGPASINAASALARESPEVPALIVSCDQGIGGTAAMAEPCIRLWANQRACHEVAAPFKHHSEPEWGHGMLLEPTGVARHLNLLLALDAN